MNIGNIGKALANQAIESTKNSLLDTVKDPAPRPSVPQGPPEPGAIILGQLQAMQRPLKEDQELLVQVRAGDEMLRVHEIFVPSNQVLVFSGADAQGNVTRVIAPAETVQVVCRVVRVATGVTPVRISILTPKPPPKPAA